MLVHLFASTILLLNLNVATQTRISELEACKKHLENVVTVIRDLVTTVDNIQWKKYVLTKPANCEDLLYMGNTESGIYTIYPKVWNGTYNPELSVYCDMATDGGGWIVFQRRGDYQPQQDFFQGWETYKRGFGQLDRDFWLGNENLHVLTHQEKVVLRVDLEDFENNTGFATYDDFNISNCEDKYRLHIGNYNGDAGDSLSYHHNHIFATFDNDGIKRKCANEFKGAWWYDNCHISNLNGLYTREASGDNRLVVWRDFKDTKSLKKSEMKFRPSNFNKPT